MPKKKKVKKPLTLVDEARAKFTMAEHLHSPDLTRERSMHAERFAKTIIHILEHDTDMATAAKHNSKALQNVKPGDKPLFLSEENQ